MGKNLSPALSQELANLGKDADSRRTAMKTLKLYLKNLDSKTIPLFLAKVSETKNAGSSYGEYTISLYEVLARVHGPKIVSQLENIMSTVIKTLRTSGGSFPLQQACSKVVPAIARYGIEPTTPEDKKRHVIHSLCKPLSDSLLSNQESLSCGAALCLKALVDSDNWRFASAEMVNEVCLKLTSALKDTSTQTNSHMGLVMSLAKRNSFLVEAYARLLVKAGSHILNNGLAEKNSQKRLTAIQMVHSLMKCLDIRSVFFELDLIIEEMEKCQSDPLPFVKGAAFEALQTAKKLLAEKASKMTDSDIITVTGSNFCKSGINRRVIYSSSSSASPLSGSPESHTFDAYVVYDESFMVSPVSTFQASCNRDQNRKNPNWKLRRENGCTDTSQNDGIYSEQNSTGSKSCVSFEHDGKFNTMKSYRSESQVFVPGSRRSRALRNQTPSPQRTNSPRKQLHLLQYDKNSEYFDDQARRHWSQRAHLYKDNGSNINDGCKLCKSDSESVSSTEDVVVTGTVTHKKFQSGKKFSSEVISNSWWKIFVAFVLICLIIFVAFVLSLLSGDHNRCHNLVPT